MVMYAGLAQKDFVFFVVVDLLVYVVFQYVYNTVCIHARTNAHTIE